MIISFSLFVVFTLNALQFPVFFFFFLFFCLSYPELQNCKSVFMILKIWHGGGLKNVHHFLRYPNKIWYQNWYLDFYKGYDRQIWQAGASIGFDSNETNQANASDVIKSRYLKIYLHYKSAHSHQTWQEGNFPWWVSAHKDTWPFDYVVL